MKHIHDPLDDFSVLNRKPTEKESKMLSERIRLEKEDRAKDPSAVNFLINSNNPSQVDFKEISKHIKLAKEKNASKKKPARVAKSSQKNTTSKKTKV